MTIRPLTTLAAAALLCASGTAAAASPLKFSYFEADYLNSKPKDSGIDLEGEGFRLALSRVLGPRAYFLAEYDSREYRDIKFTNDTLSVGLGLKTNTRRVPSFAAFGAATYERLDVDVEGVGKSTDEGYGLQVGLRGFFAELFEVNVSYKYLNYGEDADGEDFDLDVARVGLVVPFSLGFALTGHYQNIDSGSSEVDEYVVGLRFNFGQGGLAERKKAR